MIFFDEIDWSIYLNRLFDSNNISKIKNHNTISLIRTDLRTEFSESVYCY